MQGKRVIHDPRRNGYKRRKKHRNRPGRLWKWLEKRGVVVRVDGMHLYG
jgi:hypothetical protein